MSEGAGNAGRTSPVPGSSLGAYDIIELLGAGGMGEVFRARDSKLNRDVALKFLPEELSSDEQLLARFEREAKLLALVNHPNIATIHAIEEAGGSPFLVLELVEGENLSQVLQKGPLPVHEALKFCRQIAAALEAAHRKGIVHRDLKPANVVVTPDGLVKVLDFGIAKAIQFGEAASGLAEDAESHELTATGTLIGTGPYMSPEQVRGKSAGKRADIWAFGCVLYQTLTGKPAFGRDTLADTLTSILEQEPNWDLLPGTTPESIRRLMKRCLAKDLAERLQHIGDARIEIDETIRTPSARLAGAAAEAPVSRLRLAAGLVIGIALGAVAAGLAVWSFGPAATPSPEVQFSIQLPPNGLLGLGGGASVDVSRDGERFVFVVREGGNQQLYRRARNRTELTRIEGTLGAESPFFSPDGDWVGFFAAGELRRVPYAGGEDDVQVVCEVSDLSGASWAPGNTIYFGTPASGLMKVPASGGSPEPFTTRDAALGEIGHRWPQVLPDGETVLFTVWAQDPRQTRVAVASADGAVTDIVPNARYGRHVAPAHLLFVQDGALHVAPFHPEDLQLGEPVRIEEELLNDPAIGVVHLAVADDGTAIYAPGDELRSGPAIAWVADDQTRPEVHSPGGAYAELSYPRASPGGGELALQVGDGDRWDIAVLDLDDNRLNVLTLEGIFFAPEWSETGDRLIFGSASGGLFSMPAAGTITEPVAVTGSERFQAPTSWCGDLVLFTEVTAEGLRVGVVDASAKTTPETFLAEAGVNLYEAVFSPDCRWVAYVRNPLGQREVYVRGAPGSASDEILQISFDGGSEPMWSEDGKSIIYRREDDRFAEVTVETEPNLDRGDENILLDGGPYEPEEALSKANYDIDPDGRLVMIGDAQLISTNVPLTVVLNWPLQLERRAPSGR